MNFCIEVWAKPHLVYRINRQWQKAFGSHSFLVYSASIPWRELAHRADLLSDGVGALIPLDKSDSLGDLPALGRGQLNWQANPSGEVGHGYLTELRAMTRWIIEHRAWFYRIEGLERVAQLLNLHLPNDIVFGQPYPHSIVVDFEDLPEAPQSDIYQLCREHQAPIIWKTYLDFKRDPGYATWMRLKDIRLPWFFNDSVMDRIKLQKMTVDDEVIPSEFQVEFAFRRGLRVHL